MSRLDGAGDLLRRRIRGGPRLCEAVAQSGSSIELSFML
jgi:hypothetical protein